MNNQALQALAARNRADLARVNPGQGAQVNAPPPPANLPNRGLAGLPVGNPFGAPAAAPARDPNAMDVDGGRRRRKSRKAKKTRKTRKGKKGTRRR